MHNLNNKTRVELIGAINRRCILEGCRYGYVHLHENPLDHCIYCGAERPKYVPVLEEDVAGAYGLHNSEKANEIRRHVKNESK